MANATLEASSQRVFLTPRPQGDTVPMRGEGHVRPGQLDLGPIDPSTLGRQIVGSNQIEGVEPSGEIGSFLPPKLSVPAAGSPLAELVFSVNRDPAKSNS